MKIVTVFGTRPEIIRLSEVIRRVDGVAEHILVHTGQNFDPLLSDVFFDELSIRQPNEHLGVRSADFGAQAGEIIARCSDLLARVRPDRLLILGDTNSGLASIPAARLGIPVYHMEAGNRCYDDRVPEEINRRIIDHTSDVLLPYTYRSKENLVREGIDRARIFVIGNPILEVLNAHADAIAGSQALSRHGLTAGKFGLATVHRAENVDIPERLASLLRAFDRVADTLDLPLVVSVHPRTADRIARNRVAPASKRVTLIQPLGLFDFVHLEKNARVVLSDSGTVQEECCIFRIPNVTIRDVTERPETVECGSNVLAGADPDRIVDAVRLVLAAPPQWQPPPEYLRTDASRTVVNILTGHREYRRCTNVS